MTELKKLIAEIRLAKLAATGKENSKVRAKLIRKLRKSK